MTDSPYCEKCGGCGYIGCCGIVDFLIKHVTGKTNCLNEGSFLSDILDAVEDFYGVTITEKQRKKITGITISTPPATAEREGK